MANVFFILLLASIASLAIGLAKPSVFVRFLKKTPGRRQIAGVFGGLMILSFIGIGIFSPPAPIQDSSAGTQNVPVVQDADQGAPETLSDVVSGQEVPEAPANIPVSNSAPAPAKTEDTQSPLYAVVSVVDGDTLKLSINGTTETMRLIGMDTPETVDPRKPVQCFGKEASSKAKELLSGRSVRIEEDASQGTRDKYGRLLGYVFRDDGLFYNKHMIEQGYAHEYTYNLPYKYQAEFKAAEKSARENQRGLWSPDTCNGDTTSTASGSSGSQTDPAAMPSEGKFYTSSYYTSKYWYPESCDGWKSLSKTYLKAFDTLEALLASYPSRTKSPQCE